MSIMLGLFFVSACAMFVPKCVGILDIDVSNSYQFCKMDGHLERICGHPSKATSEEQDLTPYTR
jgi:hypothetical protein